MVTKVVEIVKVLILAKRLTNRCGELKVLGIMILKANNSSCCRKSLIEESRGKGSKSSGAF